MPNNELQSQATEIRARGHRQAAVINTNQGEPRSEGKQLAKPREIGAETLTDKRNRLITEGRLAMVEHAARNAAIDKNTQRLRALRLAKEAADREAALLNPVPEKPKRKKAASKAAPVAASK